MDGFVVSGAATTSSDGHFVMSYYEQADLPFYYWLASTYALNDRHFPSVRSGTFPNRDYMLLGTSDGVMSTGGGFPNPETPTIFDKLDQAGVTWGVYSDGGLLSETLNWDYTHKDTGHFADFIAALDGNTLPQVTFVDGIDNVEDEHPTADVQRGEAWTRNIYEHALASRYWNDIALIWTYDEAGGFFDHVAPPEHLCVARPQDSIFFEAGTRVPLVVISPWARAHYVSHVVQDHTAITRFIEAVYDLPALTARDANSDALFDMFDFHRPDLSTPPSAPAAGTGGCQELTLSLDKPVYAPRDPINVTFRNAPGTNPLDQIAIYTYGPDGATLPSPGGALLWSYIGGTQVPTTAPPTGTVTLDAQRVEAEGDWPLTPGGYIVYYLPGGGYLASASVDFNCQSVGAPAPTPTASKPSTPTATHKPESPTPTPTPTPLAQMSLTPTSTPPESQGICGDGIVDPDEQCDLGSLCVAGIPLGTSCRHDADCGSGGRCEPVGGAGCAANCTAESRIPVAFNDAARSSCRLPASA